MTTAIWVIGLFVVLLITLLSAAHYFMPLVRAYRATDDYRRIRLIHAECNRLRAELGLAQSLPPEVPTNQIRSDAWNAKLRTTSLESLLKYPGIGQATLARLAEAGSHSLFDAENLLAKLVRGTPRIGPSRAKEVRSAVNKMLHFSRREFEFGTCPFAQQARDETQCLTAQREATIVRNEAVATGLRHAIRDLQADLDSTDKVTFWSFLRQRRAASNLLRPRAPNLVVSTPPPELKDVFVASSVLQPQTATPKTWMQAVASLPTSRRASPLPASEKPSPSSELLRPDTQHQLPNVTQAAPVVLPVLRPPMSGIQNPPLRVDHGIPVAQPVTRLPVSVEAIATILIGVARADTQLSAAEREAVRRGLAKFFESYPVLARNIEPALDRLAATPLHVDGALKFAATLQRIDRHILMECVAEVSDTTGTRRAAQTELIERLEHAIAAPGAKRVTPAAQPAAPCPTPLPDDLRANSLLDGLIREPVPLEPSGVVNGTRQGLRDNALLDEVFGGR